MTKYVAVDDKLDTIRQRLESEGYQTKGLTDDLKDVMAVVVSGMDKNFLSHQEISTDAPVIDARGRSEDQIVKEIRQAEEIATGP